MIIQRNINLTMHDFNNSNSSMQFFFFQLLANVTVSKQAATSESAIKLIRTQASFIFKKNVFFNFLKILSSEWKFF